MKFAIYGASFFGECFYQLIDDANSVVCWIDQNKSGTRFKGIPVVLPEEAPRDVTVIVAVLPLLRSNRSQIKPDLLNLGFNSVLDFFEAADRWPEIYKAYAQTEHLWISSSSQKMIDEEQILWLSSRLKDRASKKVLSNIINFRRTLDPSDYVFPDDETEYFPESIPFPTRDPVKLIDCGAYTGDSVSDFLELHNQGTIALSSCLSFEPDRANFERLVSVIDRAVDLWPEVAFLAIPSGVWESSTILSFSSGMTSSSSFQLDSGDSESVPVVSLDDIAIGGAPNFIKMDIEGAETEALRGAQKIIRRYKPILAICVYHKPGDLWEIPRLIDSISDQYDMYLRVHEHLGLSTVLYCIPNAGE